MHTAQPKSNSKLVIVVAIVALIILAIGAIALLALTNTPKTGDSSNNYSPNSNTSSTALSVSTSSATSDVMWGFNGTTWQPSSTAPTCAEPLEIAFPSSLTKATAILYPGQVRGGDFKPHGGARFDGAQNSDVAVSLPLDARLVQGSRYIESGEVQYLLEFIAPCGIMIRFDHLLTLDPAFQALVDAQLPAAKVDDSRTTNFNGSPMFAANTLVASAAGHTGNVGFDFGVYDLRQRNAISQNATWAAAHADEASQAYHALCWLNLLPAEQKAIALSLPGAGTEGKNSDYCK